MKKEPLNKNNPTLDEDYLYTASFRDCTGLTPTPAHNEFEAESYQELAHYLPPIHSAQTNSSKDEPIPPYNHGRTSDDIHLETRKEVTDQPLKNKHYYP